MNKYFFITAAIPYVNAAPHLGHALEFVQADTVARYHRLLGEEVILLSGADENALKNVQAAQEANVPIQEFVDKNNQRFVQLTKALNTQFDIWQRGSDKKYHFPASQKLWHLCEINGDIYKKSYRGLYCVGCEIFYEPEELDNKKECPEHPGKKLEIVSEENYFFRLSKYQDKLTKLIETEELKIIPEKRKNEALAFIRQGLKDLSISRSNERARNWGIPVPNDPSQRIYVWFDALNIYQSGIGFGWNEAKYKKWWPADVHVIGKGIIRFHAIYWPAFLMSAGLKLPKKIFAHGYITVEGKKMSKTIGNVIDPFELINKYGTDALRYYLLREIPAYDDGDFSQRRFKELYNADLANGLGNLVARVAKLAEKAGLEFDQSNNIFHLSKLKEEQNAAIYFKSLEEFRFHDALAFVWKKIANTDRFLDHHEPWKLRGREQEKVLTESIKQILEITAFLEPFLPHTAKKIKSQFSGKIYSREPLFPRLS